MSDENPFEQFGPVMLHGSMTFMVWCMKLPMIEKIVLLRVLEATDPREPMPAVFPHMDVSLQDLSEDVGATLIETSKAVSSLEAKGVLKVYAAGKHLWHVCGIERECMKLWLTPLFMGVRNLSISQKEQGLFDSQQGGAE